MYPAPVRFTKVVQPALGYPFSPEELAVGGKEVAVCLGLSSMRVQSNTDLNKYSCFDKLMIGFNASNCSFRVSYPPDSAI